MTDQGFASLVTIAVIGSAALLTLPLTVAFYRDIDGKLDIFLLGLLLGWTGVAWACALFLAMTRPRRAVDIRRPAVALPPTAPPYRDGRYLVSAGFESYTWAVHDAGGWSIVYEVGGSSRLVGAVSEGDVPLTVLADALQARV